MRFNHAFADKIMEILQPGDIVWIHDYQLLLLPEILRQRAGANVYTGLFCHTPFPSSEIIRCLSSTYLREIIPSPLNFSVTFDTWLYRLLSRFSYRDVWWGGC